MWWIVGDLWENTFLALITIIIGIRYLSTTRVPTILLLISTSTFKRLIKNNCCTSVTQKSRKKNDDFRFRGPSVLGACVIRSQDAVLFVRYTKCPFNSQSMCRERVNRSINIIHRMGNNNNIIIN